MFLETKNFFGETELFEHGNFGTMTTIHTPGDEMLVNINSIHFGRLRSLTSLTC